MAQITINTHTTHTQAAQQGTTALWVDAVFSAIAGLVLLIGGTGVAEMLGLASIGTFLGIFMTVYGVVLGVLTSRWMGARLLRAQAIANAVWIVSTEILLFTGILMLTGLGIAVLLGSNLVLLVLAVVQWRSGSRLAA